MAKDQDLRAGVPKAVPKIIEHRSYKNYNKDAFIKDLKSEWNKLRSYKRANKCGHGRQTME